MTLSQKIERFRTLGDNHDGKGSFAPSPELVDYAIWVVTTQSQRFGITDPCVVHPTQYGGVRIQWHAARKLYQLDIDEIGEVRISGVGDSQSYWLETLEIPMEAV